MLKITQKCSKTARNICCLAQKLLEIFTAWLGSARIFLENELLEMLGLGFIFRARRALTVVASNS